MGLRLRLFRGTSTIMQSYNLQRWQGALLAGGRGSRGTVCRVGPPFWRVFFFLTSTPTPEFVQWRDYYISRDLRVLQI